MPSLSSSPNLWETVKSDFKSLFPEDVFKLWFEPIVCVESAEESLTLGVPNDFAAIWINDNYHHNNHTHCTGGNFRRL